MNAWLFQDHRQRQLLGDKCPWSVGWIDPEGKRKSKKIGSHSLAEKYARKTEGQLAAGTYENQSTKKWSEFRAEYENRGMPRVTTGTRNLTAYTFNHFERIVKPARVSSITGKTIADYVAARSAETGRRESKATKADKPQALLSPATINRELRNLRTIARKAHTWGYLPRLPEFEFLREPGKLATYVSPEHFAKLYQHADAARWPGEGPYEPADWWRALMVTAYMTG